MRVESSNGLTVRAAPREHYGWLSERAGCLPTEGFRAIEAVDSQGRIRGMVGFDGWTDGSVGMHVALDTPNAARALIRPAFLYPFVQVSRRVVIGVTAGNNYRAIRFNLRLGFREALRIPDGWAPGVDLVVMTMRREDCRWISKE